MKFLTRICLVWWRSGGEGRDETDKETNEGEGGDNRHRLQCRQSFCYLPCNTQLTFKTNLKLTSMWSPPSLKEEDGLRPLACVQSPPIIWGSSPQLTLTLFTSWAQDVQSLIHSTLAFHHPYIIVTKMCALKDSNKYNLFQSWFCKQAKVRQQCVLMFPYYSQIGRIPN